MTHEALKLALEALVMYGERHRATYLLGGAWDEEITLGDKAITALEEALAQTEQIQPSAYSNTHQPERHELQAKGEHPAPCARHCEANAFQIVIKNLKAQLAQPEQEPVAWADLNALSEQINSVNCGTVYRLPSKEENRQPLYITPPQRTWVGLTGEEAMDVTRKEGHELLDFIYEYGTGSEGVEERIVAICKATEAKLKEKNT